ncbi:TPA: Lrp/AsnC ligand binding domain-containing protein [archaeon]|nr:Lrp/AsnC ligand binding domain-containing protein [Candidatus Naiadarchaeales archaeon SRR2090159.bin1288]
MKKKMVREASAVYGDFDIVAKLETDDLDKLNEFIIKDVRETEGVSETNTLIAL